MIEKPTPFFSIIIPCYNVECYIKECLDSIVNQDFEDYEVVCIDDGSTDQTVDIIRQYSEAYAKIKLISQENTGPAQARNRGIQEAQGQFVIFVDSDDYIDSDTLSSVSRKLDSQPNLDLIIFGYRRVESDGKFIEERSPQQAPNFSMFLKLHVSPSIWGKAIRTSVIKKNGLRLKKGLAAEDLDFVYKIGFFSQQGSYIDRVLYNWRIVDDSESRRINEWYINSYFYSFRKLRDFLKRQSVMEFYNYEFSVYVLELYVNLLTKVRYADENKKDDYIRLIYQQANKSRALRTAIRVALKTNTTLLEEVTKEEHDLFVSRYSRGGIRMLGEHMLPLFSKRRDLFRKGASLARKPRKAQVSDNNIVPNDPEATLKNIHFFPIVENQQLFDDIVLRATWYLTPMIKEIGIIRIPVSRKFNIPEKTKDYFDSTLSLLTKQLENKIAQIEVTKSEFRPNVTSNDDWLLYCGSEDRLELEFGKLPKATNQLNVSPLTNPGSSNYLWLKGRMLGGLDNTDNSSRTRLSEVARKTRHKKGYIFGTGPGLSLIKDHDFSDGSSIVCNSLIGDTDFLSKLKPHLAVAGDPIFHAGCSSYAEKFRNDLEIFLQQPSRYIVVPKRDAHIYDYHMSPTAKSRIIAMGFDSSKSDLSNNFDEQMNVSTTSNILTLYLLPLAGYLFDEICISGCDGRALLENKYYWGHNKDAQYTDKMQDIQNAHPGFFEVDFNSYYLKHCFVLEKWISTLERRGKTIVNLTPSYIPALYHRTIAGVKNPDIQFINEIEVSVKQMAGEFDWDNDTGIHRSDHKAPA